MTAYRILVVIALAVVAAGCRVPEPEHKSPARQGAVRPAPAVVSFTGPLTRAGRFDLVQNIRGTPEEHRVVVVGAIQPVLPPDAGPGMRNMTLQIREAHLHALPDGGASIIGGIPADAPPGTEPAPIRIDDCVVDARITLGPNVRVEDSVIRVPHAERYDGGLPLFPRARPAP